MSNSYPRRNQASGIWKLNQITKNIKDQGTWPKSTCRGLFGGGENPSLSNVVDFITIESAGNATN